MDTRKRRRESDKSDAISKNQKKPKTKSVVRVVSRQPSQRRSRSELPGNRNKQTVMPDLRKVIEGKCGKTGSGRNNNATISKARGKNFVVEEQQAKAGCSRDKNFRNEEMLNDGIQVTVNESDDQFLSNEESENEDPDGFNYFSDNEGENADFDGQLNTTHMTVDTDINFRCGRDEGVCKDVPKNAAEQPSK